jgi:Uma2 family endonuclease
MTAIILNLDPIGKLTDDIFEKLCWANPEESFERTARGELIIVTPVGGGSGSREADLISDVAYWNRRTNLGKVFSSSTLFRLPNGALRSPDVSWIKLERWNALTSEQQEGFPPLCPDFVIELRSRTDQLQPLKDKMQEYLENGMCLGWLINPQDQQVEIYRPGKLVEEVSLPATLLGEVVVPNFVLELSLFI